MSDLLKNIENFQSQYYESNKKNTFFKNKQKIELAKEVSNSFSIDELINVTCYNVANTNRVIIDYNILKLYANPENYERIIHHIVSVFTTTINTYGKFEVHMNLNTFTVTAAERHKKMVELFCNVCMLNPNTSYSESTDKFVIYYCSNSINQIGNLFLCFVSPIVKDKIVLIKKEESDVLWNSLSSP